MGTIMKSKENKVLSLFFNYPTKHWHFEEILKETKLARSKADHWLKQFINEDLIVRVKPVGKMPYYISDYDSPNYQNRKKIFALNQLYESGFLNHLAALNSAKTIILFGSFSRSDWYKDSDIDLFIYGNSGGLDLNTYERSLRREIQIFECKNNSELNKLTPGLIKNIIKGDIIKGNIDFIKVEING